MWWSLHAGGEPSDFRLLILFATITEFRALGGDTKGFFPSSGTSQRARGKDALGQRRERGCDLSGGHSWPWWWSHGSEKVRHSHDHGLRQRTRWKAGSVLLAGSVGLFGLSVLEHTAARTTGRGVLSRSLVQAMLPGNPSLA